MIPVTTILETNFDSIPIDSFWNTSDEIELKIHRIHAYPAKFPAFITTKALAFAKKESLIINALADIFCGCGTTAFEAKRNNIAFWGCDINPVATMIAKTKSKKYQDWRLKQYLYEILKAYESTPVVDKYDEANERLQLERNEYSINLIELKINKILPGANFVVNFISEES